MYKHTCKHCGEKFLSVKKVRVYCSKSCKGKAQYGNGRRITHARTLNCALCGQEFVANANNARFCSKRCGNRARNHPQLMLGRLERLRRSAIVRKPGKPPVEIGVAA